MKTGILRFKKLPKTLEAAGAPNDIPIAEGSHTYDMDVREELLDKKVVEKLREKSKKTYAAKYGSINGFAEDLPLGFDVVTAKAAGGEIIWDESPGA